jgi:hypothetical protein
LEADAQNHAAFPTGITRYELEEMQKGGRSSALCTANSCEPKLVTSDGKGISLTAKSEKVMFCSDECGSTDLCT